MHFHLYTPWSDLKTEKTYVKEETSCVSYLHTKEKTFQTRKCMTCYKIQKRYVGDSRDIQVQIMAYK